MLMNNKGQAALIDSIFFLTIVSLVCTTLFFFAINYGIQTETQINSFYSKDFSSDLLKVITLVSVNRDSSLSDDFFQSDYLLTLIKEDFADTQKMSENTTNLLVETLDSVVKPFDSSIDYAFFLTSESDSKYLFLLLATHECSEWEVNAFDINVCEDVERKYFFCEPSNNRVLEEYIFPKVGRVDTSLGKVTLSRSTDNSSTNFPFLIGFSGWIVSDIVNLTETALTAVDSDFNCSKISVR